MGTNVQREEGRLSAEREAVVFHWLLWCQGARLSCEWRLDSGWRYKIKEPSPGLPTSQQGLGPLSGPCLPVALAPFGALRGAFCGLCHWPQPGESP